LVTINPNRTSTNIDQILWKVPSTNNYNISFCISFYTMDETSYKVFYASYIYW
jgi:hypothetical protein